MKQTLTFEELEECISSKIIQPLNNLDISTQIQPSSIDITLGSIAYLLPHRALAPNISMEELGPQIALQQLDLNQKTLFLKGHTYLVETDIELSLPQNICGKCSPKSSIGRIDVLVRAVCSTNGVYDVIPHLSKGKLFLEITPQSFNIIVQKGVPMSQIRLFKEVEHTQEVRNSENQDIEILQNCIILNEEKITTQHKKNINFEENMQFLSLEINEGHFGYVAKNTQTPIDLTSLYTHEISTFFEPLHAQRGINNQLYVVIEKDKFYIFHTKELIKVPLTHSVEMLPYSYMIGDFRAHYAGFFDPGFGGENGATGVLEVRASENIVIFDSQPICSIIIYKNSTLPKIGYGDLGNNYQGQRGPKLSKFFKKD
ncbi:MAG: 2'-deoxycytidine 5'-triphosphate deaminase [Nanoarchaeota archaeon]|nr:2'-deoxycytidine 5'-triphosphate deaminase [Nanoarchaeota archaeon]